MVNIPDFKYYRNHKKEVYFEAFVNSLSGKQAGKLLLVIKKIEFQGLEVAKRQTWIDKLENNLYEIRSIFGNDIQRGLYFKPEDKELEFFIISHGFSKKQQKTPEREKNRARECRSNFEEGIGDYVER